MDLGKKVNPDVTEYRIVRQVDPNPSICARAVLVDVGNEHLVAAGKKCLVVPADSSWYVVQPWQNAIFVDESGIICLFSSKSKLALIAIFTYDQTTFNWLFCVKLGLLDWIYWHTSLKLQKKLPMTVEQSVYVFPLS